MVSELSKPVSFVILLASLILIGSVIYYTADTILYNYKNNYDMYTNTELICLNLGVQEVLINNESYICSQIMDACNINISFEKDVMNIDYDTIPFCNGIFWGR